ncbi:P-loop containing nucleoside triphosphate hydrolase protein [Blyttiomyces helicus]|uniref:P-loop containing nucleoside triphosphate hydrolase protein n=1 Tax=Blyttiomyces helicus TaxID=388810 RepID=A0A4P9WGS8_9FUNG|nr:P-loop containing nucleoside triphosphate hydrolase protein [Blyttiomyces helicus]|eukprot:RKO92009.1 P-loop containing nucleoside triphosphate hydrolase protein [Blyttiomyces helicus]
MQAFSPNPSSSSSSPVPATTPRRSPIPLDPSFRTSFAYSQKLYWHPTHQGRAQRQLKNGIHHIDLVVEVRDARIPLSSINPEFDELFAGRERLVVFNKADLAQINDRSLIDGFRQYRGYEAIFTTASQGMHIDHIIKFAVDKCKAEPHRYPYMLMVVVGLPNVGKSTLINSLRRLGVNKGKASAVGPTAGITQKIQTRVKIYDDPPIYLVDTPGIFDPSVSHPIQGLKIALTGGTKDQLTEVQNVADYLLFRLNNSKAINKYPEILGYPGPTDTIGDLLLHIAKEKNFRFDTRSRVFLASVGAGAALERHADGGIDAFLDDETWMQAVTSTRSRGIDMEFDLDRAASHMIELFRSGAFGRMTLDDCSPIGLERFFKNQPDEDELISRSIVKAPGMKKKKGHPKPRGPNEFGSATIVERLSRARSPAARSQAAVAESNGSANPGASVPT